MNQQTNMAGTAAADLVQGIATQLYGDAGAGITDLIELANRVQADVGNPVSGHARARFEAWSYAQCHHASNIDTTRDAVFPDAYESTTAQLAWRCWQAALASVQPSPAGQGEVPYDVARDLLADAYNAGRNGIGFSEQVMRLDDALAARQPVGERPLEMRICELRHVSLKPNRPYIFTVDANCASCRADAAYAMGHAGTPPAQAVTITPEMWEAGRQAHCDWIAQAYNEGTPTAEQRAEGVRRAINAMKTAAPPAQAVDQGPQKDAARYRWVRDHYDPSIHDGDDDVSFFHIAGDELDAAIDDLIDSGKAVGNG